MKVVEVKGNRIHGTQERTLYTWTVNGNNEAPCSSDIISECRTELSDYVETMFRQRYGCTVTLKISSCPL